MRDQHSFEGNQPDRRRGGRKGRWQEGGQEDGREDRGEFGGNNPERRRQGRRGGGRNRARRGDARYVLLDALRDGPKHGYEIIRVLEERSAGRYIPSPGTVYPTLQYLEDQGFVHSNQDAGRRIYQLTEAGQTELDAQAEQVTAFWEHFAGQGAPSTAQREVAFLQEELEHLNRIVWGGLRSAIAQERQETIRRVRGAVEECQQRVREVIATE
jgi:DNA-binding PadR family transcriptional regulator